MQSDNQGLFSIEDGKLKFETSGITLISTKNAYTDVAVKTSIRQSVSGTQAYFVLPPVAKVYNGNEAVIVDSDSNRTAVYINGGYNYVETTGTVDKYFICEYYSPSSGIARNIAYNSDWFAGNRNETVENAHTPSQTTTYPSYLSYLDAGVGYAEYIEVRKYVDPEPYYVSVGSEETYSPPLPPPIIVPRALHRPPPKVRNYWFSPEFFRNVALSFVFVLLIVYAYAKKKG